MWAGWLILCHLISWNFQIHIRFIVDTRSSHSNRLPHSREHFFKFRLMGLNKLRLFGLNIYTRQWDNQEILMCWRWIDWWTYLKMSVRQLLRYLYQEWVNLLRNNLHGLSNFLLHCYKVSLTLFFLFQLHPSKKRYKILVSKTLLNESS